jgi:hypothetical protein
MVNNKNHEVHEGISNMAEIEKLLPQHSGFTNAFTVYEHKNGDKL